MLRDIQELPAKTLKDDVQRTSMLVKPDVHQPENLIWKYHWTVRKEWEKRSEDGRSRE
jgi:hypothetical protein